GICRGPAIVLELGRPVLHGPHVSRQSRGSAHVGDGRDTGWIDLRAVLPLRNSHEPAVAQQHVWLLPARVRTDMAYGRIPTDGVSLPRAHGRAVDGDRKSNGILGLARPSMVISKIAIIDQASPANLAGRTRRHADHVQVDRRSSFGRCRSCGALAVLTI